MNSWTSAAALRIADYYLLATWLLLLAWVTMWFVRQPARRLTVAWATMAGLACLAVLCNLPTWPRVHVPSLLWDGPVADSPIPAREDISIPSSLPPSPTEASPGEGRPDSPTETNVAEGPLIPLGSHGSEPQPVEVVSATPGFAPQAEATSSSDSEIRSGIVVAAFSSGAALVLLWLLCGAGYTALLCRGASKPPESLEAELAEVVGRGHKIPRLLLSPVIAGSVALGIVRPTILLASAAVAIAGRRGLRAALAHEWAHIKNRDLWLLAASRCMLLLLFAHPLFWGLRRRIRADQESVADATAATGTSREGYAHELFAWARLGVAGAARQIPAGLGI
jgi:hypothetical protein